MIQIRLLQGQDVPWKRGIPHLTQIYLPCTDAEGIAGIGQGLHGPCHVGFHEAPNRRTSVDDTLEDIVYRKNLNAALT